MLDFKRKHDFLVGIDSDGCAFDSMEIKHKECFIPNTIKHFHLQAVSKFAREAAEFVNLYSKSRGANRFPALIETLEWLQKRPQVKARGFKVSIPPGLVAWIGEETKLANPALKKAVEATGNADLKQALAWSEGVNQSVEEMVHGVPPFPYVLDCLRQFRPKADVLVVSATPGAALTREWQEHGLAQYVDAICGQEVGTKKEILALAKQYEPGHVLMIGDAPGDQKAASANAALFFPINPGHEDSSWHQLLSVGIERFFKGTFAGAYQESLEKEFDNYLPALPPWPVDAT